MPEHDGLMRIFWPLGIPRTGSPGIIVGWRNSGLDVFVVAILEDVDVSSERDRECSCLTHERRGTWKMR
jgi:phosphatidylinositol glycan class Q protein